MEFCIICNQKVLAAPETGRARSNVRAFAHEVFALWRCPACQSIHARDEVELERYYASYPFHQLKGSRSNRMLALMYRNLLRRLTSHGFGATSSLLDYGCGSGHFLEYCRDAGYHRVYGYDAYSSAFQSRSILDDRYDVVLSQDVMEHVPSPREHMRALGRLVKPGGIIAVGTPNASAIDLARPERGIHALHQPYHRHIVSGAALQEMGQELGFRLVRYYPTMYANTRWPFVNSAFVLHYYRCFDNNADLAVQPPSLSSWRLWSPATLWLGLLGSFFAPKTDVMAVFAVGSQG